MVGESVGGWVIERLLWAGGTGHVYLTRHRHVGRPAVLKILLAEHLTSQEKMRRFFAGVRVASSLAHPGVVAVYDCDVHRDGRPYAVMECLEGESLRALLARGGLGDLPAALSIAAAIADVAAGVHEAGVVHRDLKPGHAFVMDAASSDAPVKLLDFDTAARAGLATAAGARSAHPVGTYVFPEPVRDSGSADRRSDIHALGCILLEMVSGIEDEATLPEGLRQLIQRMRREDPAERPDSMDQVARELRELAAL
jgi:eukaryotic-like serine/threonine-protein kinase